MTNHLLSKSLALTSLVAISVNVNAQVENLNYKFDADRPTEGEYCDGFPIVPDTGWQYCEFDSETDTDTFTVDTNQPGCFRATDYFAIGDVFTVTNKANGVAAGGGFFAGNLPLPFPDPWADTGWGSADYFSSQGGLSGNGPYAIEVTITSAPGGIPAGYYVRFDTGKACTPMKAEDLVSNRAIIVTNSGRENEDVFFPDGRAAARSVAPGVTVVMPVE